MHTDRHHAHHSSTRWDIILGVLFVMSFLGVTLALTLSDAIAAPDGTEHAITTTSDSNP